MSKTLLDQVSRHRKEIKHEVITYGLSELITMHRSGDIKIQPEYQRLFRWNRDQQSLFIESLILEIPIPPLFFYEDKDGKWELLDGLQRLSTVLKFMGTEQDVEQPYLGTANNENEWHEETRNTIDVPLQLVGTDYLSELDGFTFVRLPTSLQLNLKRSRVQIYVLKRETHPSYKYEVFKRLNTAGAQLADQEIRNAATRLINDRFPDFLQELGKHVAFLGALQLDDDEVREARADELALRFLTMKNHHSKFTHDVRELLTEYMKQVSSGSIPFDFDSEKALFARTWTQIQKATADGKIFRPKRGGMFAPTVFELVGLGVAFNIDKAEALEANVLLEKLELFVQTAKNDALTGPGSNSKKKTLGRVQRAREFLSDL